MDLIKALRLFAFVVFTYAVLNLFYWLLNQPSDLLLIAAGLLVVLYVWIAIKTKAFTQNPFKK